MTKRSKVTFKLSDGRKLNVAERELPAFRELVAAISETFPNLLNDPEIVRELWDANLTHDIFKSSIAQENASKPRKKVTCAELEEHRADFIKKNGSVRGWQKTALIDFGIADVRTLKARLKSAD